MSPTVSDFLANYRESSKSQKTRRKMPKSCEGMDQASPTRQKFVDWEDLFRAGIPNLPGRSSLPGCGLFANGPQASAHERMLSSTYVDDEPPHVQAAQLAVQLHVHAHQHTTHVSQAVCTYGLAPACMARFPSSLTRTS